MLLKKQRNRLFSIMLSAGLNPTDFEELNSSNYVIVNKQSTSFRLFVLEGDYGYGIGGFPGIGSDPEDMRMSNWTDVEMACERWASLLKEEFDTPDLWAEAQSNAKLFAISSTSPNEMFNAAELRQLDAQVRQLVQGLAALALPSHAEKLLTSTVKEIPEKATRFTKKELEGWFMGAFISQVTNLALSPEHVSAIAHLIKSTFIGLLGLN